MTNEQEPLKVDIPVEEEAEAEDVHTADSADSIDIAAELRRLGKQLGETLQAAWESEERQRVEREIREGVHNFSEEVTRVFNEAKESSAAQKVRTEADEIKVKVDSTEFSRKAKQGFAEGLGWLSEELAKLSQRLTPAEKSPEDIDDTPSNM